MINSKGCLAGIGDIIPTLYDYNLYTLNMLYNDEKSGK